MADEMALWNAICLASDASGTTREQFIIDLLLHWHKAGMLLPKAGRR